MAQVRRADATWQGDLATGRGVVSAASSGVFTALPITWHARTEASDGLTSPEELLATAHASCFAMASSNNLAKAGFQTQGSTVSVEITADKRESGWTVISSHITLRAKVPGIDDAAFQAAVEGARTGCPISRALSDSVTITLDAALEP